MSVARIAIVAAGTGGHVMPGLAIADDLRRRGWVVEWVGTRSGMERGLVEAQAIPFYALAFANMRGKGFAAALLGVWHLARAWAHSLNLVHQRRWRAVVATGGYISVPIGIAAALLGRPVFFLNADAAPQLSLKILQPWVKRVFLGFDGEASRRLGDRALVSGAPVRAALQAIAPPSQRYAGRQGPLRILVAGGSLGARALNEQVPQAMARLAANEPPLVVHQCGAGHEAATRQAYEAAGVQAQVVPFINDMAAAYAEADLVICRAGAITVSELCAVGAAAILVPLLASTTHHQADNARWMAEHGAAVHLPQSRLDAGSLAQLIGGLDRDRLEALATGARALAKPDAVTVIVDAIEGCVGRAALPTEGPAP